MSETWFRRLLARNKHRLIISAIRDVISRLYTLLNWTDDNFITNGEALRLSAFKDADEIFDVGSSTGAWALLALDLCKGARIHCFGAVEPIRTRLAARIGSHQRVFVAPLGLGDSSRDVQIKYFPGSEGWSSQFDFPHPGEGQWRRERVETGDVYMRRQAIERVDLLKIDVEGAEHLVIRGFSQGLASQSIRAVQFEYGRVNLLTGVLLRDYYQLFESFDYIVGEVRPDGVHFAAYDLGLEDFIRRNLIAIPRCETTLRERLAYRGSTGVC